MTYKANDVEQYPYLVYTDDAGAIYDPNGGGGGGEVTADSCVMLTIYDGDITDDMHFIPGALACSPTVENSMHFVEDNLIMQLIYGIPVGWICGLLEGGDSERDPGTPISFDGTETLTAYKFDLDTMEREEIAVEFTFGSYLDTQAWYFTVPAMQFGIYGLDIKIDFGS